MIKHIEEPNGKGRIACISLPVRHILVNRDNITMYNVYHYWKYLTEFLKYDKVYILTTSLSNSGEKYDNILKDCPLIYGIEKKDLL